MARSGKTQSREKQNETVLVMILEAIGKYFRLHSYSISVICKIDFNTATLRCLSSYLYRQCI